MTYYPSNMSLPYRGAPFPTYMRLPLISSAVNEAENNIKAPAPLVFFGALTAIAVASQGLIEVCKPTEQKVPVSLMLLSIANSGERKSTAENYFLNSIRAFQEGQSAIYDEKLREWKVRRKIWETKEKALVQTIAKKQVQSKSTENEEASLITHEREKPEAPRALRLLYEDSTPEALFSGLYKHFPSAGLVSGEGGAILNGKALRDLPKHNAVWSGDSITVDRASTTSYQLTNARLTVSIMAQESALRQYMERCGENSRGSGLWARFLVCQPSSTQGTRFIANGTMSFHHRDKFAVRLTEILEENVRLLADPYLSRKVLRFSPEASARWVDVFNSIESEISQGGRFFGAGDHASKLADNIARVAALFHYFEEGDGEISISDLESAISFCFWCSDEFLKVFMPPPEEESDALDLDRWLQTFRDRNERQIRKNYVRQCCPSKLREKNRLNRAIAVLCRDHRVTLFNYGKTQWLNISPWLGFSSGRLY